LLANLLSLAPAPASDEEVRDQGADPGPNTSLAWVANGNKRPETACILKYMKRIAVVIGIAATPAVVTADSSSQSKRDRYELARTWNAPQSELYGPVEVAPATYGFYSK
jgi:hypothetical protein